MNNSLNGEFVDIMLDEKAAILSGCFFYQLTRIFLAPTNSN